MRILAIETSCDETGISLLETENGEVFSVLAHDIASQIALHNEWGGVVPMLAKREHQINLPKMLGKIAPENVDLIAVTYGPGLEPALWEGIVFAKELAKKMNVPIVAVDHMHGHMVSSLLKSDKPNTYYLAPITYPAIALLISGAHTELVLMESMQAFVILGNTRDDAVGEAFDKTARMLGLRYPGGPEIAKLADKFEARNMIHEIKLPRPMLHSKDLDFSFSGLKTAVLYLIKELKEGKINRGEEGELSEEEKSAIAYEFEQAVTEVILKKTNNAIEQYDAKSLLVGGGVIASKAIRSALGGLASKLGISLYLPDNKFTGDNATMIGIAGYLRSSGSTANLLLPHSQELADLKATGNLSLYK